VKLLLDTHTLIWAVDRPTLLGQSAKAALENRDSVLMLSAATLWETAIKVGLNKLNLSISYRLWMRQAIADLEIQLLPITVEVADAQIQLPYHHRDPFDRLLAAQALVGELILVSSDPVFDRYGVNRLW
jgi:PIN domain nuclease of toxin-antitoxin system